MAASKPTSPLSLDADTLVPVHTERVFWDLNQRQGCSPLGCQPYADTPPLSVYATCAFGVGQGTDTFRCLHPQSVALQLQVSSAQARLTPTSIGTSYHRSRLAFHP